MTSEMCQESGQDKVRHLPNSVAFLVLALSFGSRAWAAHGTFLNPDEAMHFLFANKTSLAAAYRSSFSLFHPPLLQIVLYFWRYLGTSEFILRLPSVIAGTAFCWLVFRWLRQILGPTVGWIGLIFASFLPPMIALSAEVRQYALLLAFAAGAAFFLEVALASQSCARMWASSAFLWLALLTHYSAFLFAAAMGCYGLVRILRERPTSRVVISWVAGQIVGLGICAFLYVTHLSRLGAEVVASRGTQAFSSWYLPNSYFHHGENPSRFALARSFGVFQFVFGQNAVGDIAFLAFAVATVLLLLRKQLPKQKVSSPQLAFLLISPFAINCAAAFARAYPYGGTRHSVFLAMFAMAGVGVSIAWFTLQKPARALGIALLIVGICGLFATPRRPYMLRRDQARANMVQAIGAIRQQVSPGGRIFVDYQSNFLLRYYLCPEVDPSQIPFAEGIKTYDCDGYKVTMTSAEINIFTSAIFLDKWRELIRQEALKPAESVCVFQAGWDIDLAQELAELPEFQNLKPHSFGRNITIFKLDAGRPLPAIGLIVPQAPSNPKRGG